MNEQPLPLVLIPGFMLDETLWDDFVEACPSDRVYIRASLSQGQSIADYARLIVDTLPARFILVGFSLGGYVARAIAEAFPERTAGMILIATSLREDPPEQRALLDSASKTALMGAFSGFSDAVLKPSVHPSRQNDPHLMDKIRAMGKQLGAQVFRTQALLERKNITHQPPACPVLVIASEGDGMRGLEESREINALLGGDMHIIRESGHMVPLEQPRLLALTISDWLKQNVL
ncbi:alpha/beta fold hydrolase [Type-D symbiont of Plautia stali]|uniref:alpha/beta fold hydrolase n=1 Tax=Type-D symbiont of Plautia stali TaxID=1560356 RepID=UPI00073E4233|nr:alpha/beta hydrolase [Type-D symbiont of Plautia stali]